MSETLDMSLKITKITRVNNLHLGKRVEAFSMLEDQERVLKEIIKIADDEKPEAVVIAGDIYDKPNPPAEAEKLMDDFLFTGSNRKNIKSTIRKIAKFAKIRQLRAESRLPELEKHAIYFPDIVLLSLNKVLDNQVTPVGWRQCKFGAGEQVSSLVHIQVQGDCKRKCCFLGGLVVHVAAYLGKVLAVEIRALVDFHVILVLLVNESEKFGTEGFARIHKNVL